jgi:hypothetical protein
LKHSQGYATWLLSVLLLLLLLLLLALNGQSVAASSAAAVGNQLVVNRPLQLDERMVALAAAISIDYGKGMLLACRCLPPHVCHAAAAPPAIANRSDTVPSPTSSTLPCPCCRLLLSSFHPGRHLESIHVPSYDPVSQ